MCSKPDENDCTQIVGKVRAVREVEERKKGRVSCFGVAHLAGKRRNPVVVLRVSGEQLLRPGGTSERETRGKWKRGGRAFIGACMEGFYGVNRR